ncbi:hypothetical protein A2U01_0091875, partial [Trifolium medium]|nr:hypothetical protein [Trifolium medium]
QGASARAKRRGELVREMRKRKAWGIVELRYES